MKDFKSLVICSRCGTILYKSKYHVYSGMLARSEGTYSFKNNQEVKCRDRIDQTCINCKGSVGVSLLNMPDN